MPTLSITKSYLDGTILTEADLDNIRNDLTNFFNVTKIDHNNIQAEGVNVSNIGINDDEYLEFGTGNDGKIGVSSDNLLIQNVTIDKDIIFKCNDGGVTTTMLTFNADVPEILLGVNINANSKLISSLAAPVSANDAARLTDVQSAAPVGTISAYSKSSAPSGWLICDGSAVSRTTYATLFALIGVTAGQGDNSTTFNIPDFRGRFLRGVDNGVARDPDAASRSAMNTGGNSADNVFSVQAAAIGPHTHDVHNTNGGTGGDNSAVLTGSTTGTATGPVMNSSATIGNETRPINAGVWYIIKY